MSDTEEFTKMGCGCILIAIAVAIIAGAVKSCLGP